MTDTATKNGHVAVTAHTTDTGVLELSPDDVIPSPLNRPVALEDVKELLPSIEKDGQLQAGTVRPHPKNSDRYECVIGHRRLMCCRILGRKFLARVIAEPLTDADIIRMMLAENVNREDMTWFQIAEKVEQFIKASGCKQGQAAELLNLDESLVSKALTVASNLAPELVDAAIGRTSLYLIATIPDHAKQREVAQRVVEHGLKRDAVAMLVKQFRGGKDRKAKPLEIKCAGVTAKVTGNPLESLKAFLAKVGECVRRVERESLPADLLPALLK